MKHEDLLAVQRSDRGSDLSFLVTRCQERFLRSAWLLEVRSPAIVRLLDFGITEKINLEPLFPLWQVICTRYRAELYDSQATLFEDRAAQVRNEWWTFVQRLFPILVESDEFVRNVLRAIGGLPCRSSKEAADALCQYVTEMTLPSLTPVWGAPEERE
jgi:hypothetical protein